MAVKKTRINNDGTMDRMGKNQGMPGCYIEHYIFDGEHWKKETTRIYSTEYEAEWRFDSKKF